MNRDSLKIHATNSKANSAADNDSNTVSTPSVTAVGTINSGKGRRGISSLLLLGIVFSFGLGVFSPNSAFAKSYKIGEEKDWPCVSCGLAHANYEFGIDADGSKRTIVRDPSTGDVIATGKGGRILKINSGDGSNNPGNKLIDAKADFNLTTSLTANNTAVFIVDSVTDEGDTMGIGFFEVVRSNVVVDEVSYTQYEFGTINKEIVKNYMKWLAMCTAMDINIVVLPNLSNIPADPITVYPNPSSENNTIAVEEEYIKAAGVKSITYELYTPDNIHIRTIETSTPETNVEIPSTDLQRTGVYLLKCDIKTENNAKNETITVPIMISE